MDFIPLRDLGLQKRWPRLAELQDELAGLQRHQQRAEGLASTLHNELPGARERDLVEAAEALRSGKDAPENVNEKAAEQRLERARRDAVVYRRAAEATMSDIGALRAQHQTALYRDVVEARDEIARKMAEAARTASSAFSRYEGLARLSETLRPPEAVPEITGPQKNTNVFMGFANMGQRVPDRGTIEQTLAHLVELGEAASSAKDAQQATA